MQQDLLPSTETVLTQVEQAKQEWETTVDSLPQLVCLVNQQRVIVRANRTVEQWGLASVIEVKGQTIHQVLHGNCTWGDCYLPEFLERAWHQLAQGLPADHEVEDEMLNRVLFLQLRPISKNNRRQFGPDTNYAALIVQDVTEAKQLEFALHEANEALEQRVEERTTQLQRIALENARLYEAQREQYRRLQQSQEELIQIEKMAALGRLVASIAHEINNPLQSVQGFLDLLDEELAGQRRQEKINNYLSVAGSEIERISAIVRRMRDFYRASGQSQPTTPESLDAFYQLTQQELHLGDLHEMLESVLLLTNKKLQHSHIKIERKWAESLPQIEVNVDHIKQVFLNLTLNAIDAMADGGGTLSIQTSLGQAQLHGDQPQAIVQIEFKDSGLGISSEALPHLFEPLFTTKEQGSGFGLSTSYEIIKAHAGQITATSQPGQGTTFTIMLPVERPT